MTYGLSEKEQRRENAIEYYADRAVPTMAASLATRILQGTDKIIKQEDAEWIKDEAFNRLNRANVRFLRWGLPAQSEAQFVGEALFVLMGWEEDIRRKQIDAYVNLEK